MSFISIPQLQNNVINGMIYERRIFIYMAHIYKQYRNIYKNISQHIRNFNDLIKREDKPH